MSEDDVLKSKKKLRHTCEKYSDIKVPNKYKTTTEILRQNNSIVVLKQNKGRGVVTLDKNIYVGKCLSMLDTYESKVQRTLRKIK